MLSLGGTRTSQTWVTQMSRNLLLIWRAILVTNYSRHGNPAMSPSKHRAPPVLIAPKPRNSNSQWHPNLTQRTKGGKSLLLLRWGGRRPFAPLRAGDRNLFLASAGRCPFAALSSGRPNLQCQPHCGRIAVDVGVVVERGTPRAWGKLAAWVARLGPGVVAALAAWHGRWLHRHLRRRLGDSIRCRLHRSCLVGVTGGECGGSRTHGMGRVYGRRKWPVRDCFEETKWAGPLT